jgi:V-type H+-transporting ATPase subunit a
LCFFCISCQAGELFHSAQSSVAAQQSELEAYNTAEASIDSALLLEQVLILVFSVLYHSS